VKLIVLDRDGVINEASDEIIKEAQDFVPIEGSIEAIVRLSQNGYRVIVITNQSGIAHGLLTIDEVSRVHIHMQQLVASQGGRIDAVLFCPHAPDDDCSCRKPKPGMLHDLMERLNVELDGVPFVGDSLRDLQTAMVVGASPVLVKTGHGTTTLEENKRLDGIEIYDDLASFVEQMLVDQEQAEED